MSTPAHDARAEALGAYLAERAAALSLSADVTDSQDTARAGMALLDAAHVARGLGGDDARLTALSEAGLFETMPHGQAVFRETAEVRAVVQRPLAGAALSGEAILGFIVAAVTGR